MPVRENKYVGVMKVIGAVRLFHDSPGFLLPVFGSSTSNESDDYFVQDISRKGMISRFNRFSLGGETLQSVSEQNEAWIGAEPVLIFEDKLGVLHVANRAMLVKVVRRMLIDEDLSEVPFTWHSLARFVGDSEQISDARVGILKRLETNPLTLEHYRVQVFARQIISQRLGESYETLGHPKIRLTSQARTLSIEIDSDRNVDIDAADAAIAGCRDEIHTLWSDIEKKQLRVFVQGTDGTGKRMVFGEWHSETELINPIKNASPRNAIDCNNEGLVHLEHSRLEQAVELFEKALAMYVELDDKEGMAGTYGNLGNVYQTRGELDQAVEMYKKSLALNIELGHKKEMNGDVVSVQSEGIERVLLSADTDFEEHKLNRWQSLQAEIVQSREIRDEIKRKLQLNMKAQRELLEHKIGTVLDVGKKLIFDEYLSDVDKLETNIIIKMDTLESQNDQYVNQQRVEYFEFFDRAREGLKRWENNPERYNSELERLNEQEQKRLHNLVKRVELLEKKRNALLEQTLKICEIESDIDKLKKKFNIF